MTKWSQYLKNILFKKMMEKALKYIIKYFSKDVETLKMPQVLQCVH